MRWIPLNRFMKFDDTLEIIMWISIFSNLVNVLAADSIRFCELFNLQNLCRYNLISILKPLQDQWMA